MKKKVFIVDDENIITDSLVAILRLKGYEASGFYDGESALSAFEKVAPDCIVSDVMMPGMNGVELALKAQKRMPSCKVLLFSGQAAMMDLLESARASGHVLEVLTKPVHPSDLLARLEATDLPTPMSMSQSLSECNSHL